jgi:hypothetical protein
MMRKASGTLSNNRTRRLGFKAGNGIEACAAVAAGIRLYDLYLRALVTDRWVNTFLIQRKRRFCKDNFQNGERSSPGFNLLLTNYNN